MSEFVRCLCGKLYRVMSMYCGDQSVCPSCKSARRKEYEEQK